MKKLLFTTMLTLTAMLQAQILMTYNCDDFSGGQFASVGNSFAGAGVFTITSPTAGEMQVACNVPANSYKMFQVYFPSPSSVDVSGQLPLTVQMKIKATADVDIRIDLQDNVTYQATNQAYVIKTITAGSTFQTVDFTFDASAFTGSSPVSVDQTKISTFVIYIAHNASSTYTGTVTFDEMTVGTSTTSVGKSNVSIVDASIYPNPTTTQSFIINLELDEVSDIQVVVSDLAGHVISKISQLHVKSFQELLATDQLTEGTYVVTFMINSKPVKTELLVLAR